MTDLQSFTLMMASAQVVETSVNTNNSPSQDYTTNPDDHSNHNNDFSCLFTWKMGTERVVGRGERRSERGVTRQKEEYAKPNSIEVVLKFH